MCAALLQSLVKHLNLELLQSFGMDPRGRAVTGDLARTGQNVANLQIQLADERHRIVALQLEKGVLADNADVAREEANNLGRDNWPRAEHPKMARLQKSVPERTEFRDSNRPVMWN